MPIAKITKKVGDTTVPVGRLLYNCKGGKAIFKPAFLVKGGFDLEVSAEKVTKSLGAAAKFVGKKDVADFVDQAQALVPSGKIGFSAMIFAQVDALPCPDDEKRPELIDVSVYVRIGAQLAGNYGFVKGKAGIDVLVEIASYSLQCDCGGDDAEGKVLVVLADDAPNDGPDGAVTADNPPANEPVTIASRDADDQFFTPDVATVASLAPGLAGPPGDAVVTTRRKDGC